MSNVGFIGTSHLGAKMIANMIKNGSKLKVYDLLPDAAKSVAGATVCKTPQEAASNVDVVFTMLPDGNAVKNIVLRTDGIAKGIKQGALMIDCSTIEPKHVRELSAIAKENGYRFVDCPVSGGITEATAGTLTFMIGGDTIDVETATPFLLQAGVKIFHCGGPGAGQIANLCNNLIVGVTMAAMAEAFNMGIKAGLDPRILTDIVNISSGRCWCSEAYNPVPGILPDVPSSNGYHGGLSVELVAKDLALAEALALDMDCPLPMTAAVRQLYQAVMGHGLADKDFSVIFQFWQEKS